MIVPFTVWVSVVSVGSADSMSAACRVFTCAEKSVMLSVVCVWSTAAAPMLAGVRLTLPVRYDVSALPLIPVTVFFCAPDSMPSNLVLSVLDIRPAAEVVAAALGIVTFLVLTAVTCP